MIFGRVKPLDAILATAEKKSLHRSLGAFQLTLFGIGCIIGTGIFVLPAAGAQKAGPGLMLAFIIAGAVWYFFYRPDRGDRATRTEPREALPPLTSGSRPASGPVASTAPRGWEALTTERAERGRVAVESLGQRSGPVFANLSAAEAASYIFLVVAKQLPPSAKNAEAMVSGDRLQVRSDVKLSDFGGAASLGPLASLLGDRDSVRLGGTINMIRPGLGEFRLREVKLGKLNVPSPLIPRLTGQIRKGDRVEGTSSDGLPMKFPDYISDVRISNGRITLYKNVQ